MSLPSPPAAPRQHLTKGVCQVEGCYTDLGGLRDYHMRYKICEFHLKTPSIVREGRPQRFCQQCGRFHNLTEFDGAKRSCRARLQRHNARRRKRDPDEAAVAGMLDPTGAPVVMAQLNLGDEPAPGGSRGKHPHSAFVMDAATMQVRWYTVFNDVKDRSYRICNYCKHQFSIG